MPCDGTEIGQEEFEGSWTPEEIAQMEAEANLARAKAEVEVVKMANDRGWSRSYFSKMKRESMDRAAYEAHMRAHDRHFLRMIARKKVAHG